MMAIAILFVLGISYAGFSSALSRMNIHVASAEDEQGAEENKNDEDNKDVEENKNEDEDENDKAEQNGKTSKEDDDVEEARQAKTERVRTKSAVAGDKEEEDEQDGDEQDEVESDSAEDITEEMQDANKDVRKLEIKISALANSGADVDPFTASLGEIKDLISQVKAKINSGDLAGAEDLLDIIEDKRDGLEDRLGKGFDDEEADEEGEEDELENEVAKEYKNSVAQFVHTLKAVGEREGGIGQQVKVVAQAQNDSQLKVENAVKAVNGRSGFAQFLIGADYENIKEVRNEIAQNQNRIAVLTQLMTQASDQAVKDVLQDQVKVLQQENTKLQEFANINENKPSVFGWLVRLFS